MQRTDPARRPMGIIIVAIVELTLTTAYIHLSLGGLLFTLNAIGYVALAAAMLAIGTVPHPLVRRFDWLPRLGLAAYTLTTIVAYVVIGPHFTLGWVAKAIEVAIVTLIAADLRGAYGTPAAVIRAARTSLGWRSGSGPIAAS